MPSLRHITILACAVFAFLSIVRNHDSRTVMSADDVRACTEMVQAQDNSAEFQTARKANSLFRAPRTIASTWSGRPSVTFDFGSALHASAAFDGRKMACVALNAACRRIAYGRSIDRNIVLHNLRL